MELINIPEEVSIVKESIKDSSDIIKLSIDPNGTHVLQKIISSVKEEKRHEINQTVLDNIDRLVLDPNGVCVVKKFVIGNTDDSLKKVVIDKIEKNCLEIIQSPYGNYIIQHIFEVTKDLII
jgi:citrate lyase gamma subunit